MDDDSDRIPALHLTLDHYLPLAGDDWVRVTGLTLEGADVVVATGADARVRVPGSTLVHARLSGELSDPGEDREVQRRIRGWYAGDLTSAERAAGRRRTSPAPEPTQPRVAYGHPVPPLTRDPRLVGIFGGDLDAVVDTLAPKPGAQRSGDPGSPGQQRPPCGGRSREDGSPPEPISDDLLAEQMATYYGGDLGAVTPAGSG